MPLPGDLQSDDDINLDSDLARAQVRWVRAHPRYGTRGVREHLRHTRENTVLAESLGILMHDEIPFIDGYDAADIFTGEVGRRPTANELTAFERGAG